MTELLPGFRAQLETRAQQLDDRHGGASRVRDFGTANARPRRGPRRLHGRGLAATILIGAASLSGVAYAAKEILWSPPLGNKHFRGPQPTASASPVPADQLKAFAILRRPQTALDRGVASRFALTLTGGKSVIRTNAVRRLATGANGGAVVLVPYAQKEGGGLEMMRAEQEARRRHVDVGQVGSIIDRDETCITYLDGYFGGGVTCANTNQLLSGGLAIGESNPQCIVPEQKRDFAKAQRNERKMAAAEGRPAVEMQCDRRRDARMVTHAVGVVPDGVAAIKLSHEPGSKIIPVHHNVWQADGLGFARNQVWLDADGREMPRRLADTRRRLGLSPG